MDDHEAMIELFEMILERNELCRLCTNTRQRSSYWYRKMFRFYNQEKVEKEMANAREAWSTLNAFTKRTHPRRMQLQKQFNTLQRKDASNIVRNIKVNDKEYSIIDMKLEIMDYEATKILLGVDDESR